MKKIPYIFSILAVSLGVVGCSEIEDDAPVLNEQPAAGGYQDFLNVPEMAEQLQVLTSETANGYIALTCSQPDYGFAAAATYSVEVSLTPGYLEGATAASRDDSSDNDAPGSDGEGGLPLSVILGDTSNDCANIQIANSQLATAIMDMTGIESPDALPTQYYPVYVRLIAQILAGSAVVPNTKVYSNVITLKGVSLAYIPAVEAGQPSGIYLRGDMNGWDTSNEFVTTTTAGTYVVEDMAISANQGFKVASADWGDPNCGTSGTLQFNVPYVMDNSSNSGNIVCPADFMGDVFLTVSKGTYTITLVPYEEQEAGVKSNIYLTGGFAPANWDWDDSLCFLTARYVNNWVIESATVPAGSGFKIAAKGWGDPNCGGTDKEFKIGEAYVLFNDGGSDDITMPENFTGKVNLRLKNGDYIVTFVPAE